MKIILNKQKVETWMQCREWNQRQIAQAVNCDEGSFSKMIKGELEPSKQLMKKLMILTGLGFTLFEFVRDEAKLSKSS